MSRARRFLARFRNVIPAAPLLAILTVLPCALLGGCGGREKAPRNILLISVDTLRRDRLGFHGASRAVSPNLDTLAAEGIVFDNARSCSGWTLPSMATILTGREPMQHSATDFHYRLNPNVPTLASILGAHGYDTRGYVSHILLSPTYGMEKGFARFDYSVLQRGNPHEVSTSKELTDLALRDLADLKEPFVVWVHYFDPHFEYLEHDPWTGFGDAPSDRYDQEIAYTDREIGRVLEFFRERKLLERTLVVFTADHGEEFGEHGGEYHETCFDEVLRVPLVIRAPGGAPGRDARPAAQIDLLPTMLAAVGVEPDEPYEGVNLLAGTNVAAAGGATGARAVTAGAAAGEGMAGATPASSNRLLFIERDRPPGWKQRAVLQGPLKLVRIVESDTMAIPEASRGTFSVVRNVSAGTWLYDLALDPRETRSILDSEAEAAARLLAALNAHFAGQLAPAGRIEITPEMRERLRSLGYIR